MATKTAPPIAKGVDIPCLICETKNPSDAIVCTTCGAPMALIQEALVQERDPCIVTVLGDSNVGIVRGVGAEVERFAPGDRVISGLWHASEYIAAGCALHFILEIISSLPVPVHGDGKRVDAVALRFA